MRVREGCREGRGEAKFVRTCPGSEPPSLGVAAGNCGGSLPLSPLPPSWRRWGRGGDVSAPPRPPPGRAAGILLRGPPPGQEHPASSAPERSPRPLRSLPGGLGPSPPGGGSPALPSAGVRSSHSAPERPRSPAACTPLRFLFASPLPQRFPRVELQVMLSLFCS